MTTLPHICQNCIIHPLYTISYFAGLCLLSKLLHSSSVHPIWFINRKQNVIRLPHLSEITFRYISTSFISIKWKLTWQLPFLHVKKCLSYALYYYICKALFQFSAWIQAFANVINVNAACRLATVICVPVSLLCILHLQGCCDWIWGQKNLLLKSELI